MSEMVSKGKEVLNVGVLDGAKEFTDTAGDNWGTVGEALGAIGNTLSQISIGDGPPICGYNFKVVFDFVNTMYFSKISGIQESKDVKYIKEGGRNDMALMFNCPKSEGVKLTFERGMAHLGVVSRIRDISIKRRLVMGEIFIYDQCSNVSRMYMFQSQGITKWSLGTVDAASSSVLIETIEISTTGLEWIV